MLDRKQNKQQMKDKLRQQNQWSHTNEYGHQLDPEYVQNYGQVAHALLLATGWKLCTSKTIQNLQKSKPTKKIE